VPTYRHAHIGGVCALALARVTWTARGSDNFIVTLHGQHDTLLVNEIPPNPASGETFLNAGGGDYDLEIQAATLTWTVTFTPI
jgi:hypothetical protein